MAGAARNPDADLGEDLLAHGPEYDYFQAVRLLSRLAGKDTAPARLRSRPALSLARPATDVSSIRRLEDGGVEITTTFQGLYGVSSPLPAFYTQDMLAEAAEYRSESREFLDILHYHLYPLLFDAWGKYRFALQAVEEGRQRYWDLLLALCGLDESGLLKQGPEAQRLLRYLGLLVQQPRNALGLETLLRDWFDGMPIEVAPCQARKVKPPADQEMRLGTPAAVLGSAVLGQQIADVGGKFAIRIGPLDGPAFARFLQDSGWREFLGFIVNLYVARPLACDVVLILAPEVAEPATLGGNDFSRLLGNNDWSCLGRDTWLLATTNAANLQTVERLVE